MTLFLFAEIGLCWTHFHPLDSPSFDGTFHGSCPRLGVHRCRLPVATTTVCPHTTVDRVDVPSRREQGYWELFALPPRSPLPSAAEAPTAAGEATDSQGTTAGRGQLGPCWRHRKFFASDFVLHCTPASYRSWSSHSSV